MSVVLLSCSSKVKLLMQHIPEKNFKMIRYYGLYARHRKEDKVLRRGRSAEYQRLMVSFTHSIAGENPFCFHSAMTHCPAPAAKRL